MEKVVIGIEGNYLTLSPGSIGMGKMWRLNRDALRKDELYTVDDIYALPNGKRAELIDGKIYYLAPPNTKHQRLVHFFDREIGNYIQSKHGECETFPAPFAVFLDEDDINYVEPDISVICDKNKNILLVKTCRLVFMMGF